MGTFRFPMLLWAFLIIPTSAVKPYIVYMGVSRQELDSELIALEHHGILSSVLGSKEAAASSIIYSYKHCFNGFAALLQPEHASMMSDMPGVVSVFPSRMHSLDTTYSWKFLGLEKRTGITPDNSLWSKTGNGTDVIIGMLDSGVWPESMSFNDAGMGPIPPRWKGVCQEGQRFGKTDCNRKIIGARYFFKGAEAEHGPLNVTNEFLSARDNQGHGTHTSSTAGGSPVSGANFFGFANGTAKGGAPFSRLAIYKVCWLAGCSDADVLAAFDAGIHDGVDVFSASLGTGPPSLDYFADGIAIGGFHAVQNGKIVVCSAGNAGPAAASVHNVAPWLLTVAASSTDRYFGSYAKLGNHQRFKGESLSSSHLKEKLYPLVSAFDVQTGDTNISSSGLCLPGSLDPRKTKGRIVACLRGIDDRIEKGMAVRQAGGVGMILCNSRSYGNEISADVHVLPATQLNFRDGASVFRYINKSRSPTAYITPAKTYFNARPAPVMADFSSAGPNTLTPDILKPDITAPGVEILAAWQEDSTPLSSTSKYYLASGTSMSCPHVSGIAALLKALHPNWSPAALRSAIMTTAVQIDDEMQPIRNEYVLDVANPFNYGSGHVNPNAAADPGLVYDLDPEDYVVLFLCSIKYNQSSLRTLTGKNASCPEHPPSVSDLNYPSIAISNLVGTQTVRRTLTNVGGKGIYKVTVSSPTEVAISITPTILEFSKRDERREFSVELRVKRDSGGKYIFGHFTWTDGKHLVRSPVAMVAKFRH